MWIFVLLCAILWGMIYFTLFFVSQKNDVKQYCFTPPVSVIIAAKNEAENLALHLPYILTQEYPEFEVIIAVNNTTDTTIQVLEHLQQEYSHLKWIEINTVPEKFSPKKYALAQAIQRAKYEYLLFTDADCVPNSNTWIKIMMSSFANPKIEMVLGYSPYKRENTILNSFIQYETIFTAIQYLGLAQLGIPYMGVGRNIAYKKSLFQKYTFNTHKHILSGDDDLFVNQTANKTNIAIQITEKAWVYSIPKKTWQSWYRQKSRHISTGKYYKIYHLIILGILSLLNFILPFLPFLYFLIQEKIYIFAIPLVFVYFYTTVLFSRYCIRIRPIHFILLPFLYSVYQAVFSIKGIFSKKHKTW